MEATLNVKYVNGSSRSTFNVFLGTKFCGTYYTTGGARRGGPGFHYCDHDGIAKEDINVQEIEALIANFDACP